MRNDWAESAAQRAQHLLLCLPVAQYRAGRCHRATAPARAEDSSALGCTHSTQTVSTFSPPSSKQPSACDSGTEKLSLKSPELDYCNTKKFCDLILLLMLFDIKKRLSWKLRFRSGWNFSYMFEIRMVMCFRSE